MQIRRERLGHGQGRLGVLGQGSLRTPPWVSDPHALVSLWEIMLKTYAGTYAYFTERLAAISALLRADAEPGRRSGYEQLRALLPAVITNCDSLGCTSARAHAERIAAWLEADELANVPTAVDELIVRLTDDLGNQWFLHVRGEFVLLYGSPEPFGPLVSAQFPSAIIDLEEAAKCLALGRATACVFHLMRASEVGIKATLRVLNITQVYPTWGAYIGAIKDAIRGHPDEAFFREIVGDLESIKLAWRDPSMHVERTYTIEQAHGIYRAVGIFIGTLATKVGE